MDRVGNGSRYNIPADLFAKGSRYNIPAEFLLPKVPVTISQRFVSLLAVVFCNWKLYSVIADTVILVQEDLAGASLIHAIWIKPILV